MFSRNEGNVDRGIRLVVGIALLWGAWNVVTLQAGALHWVAIVVGVLMLFTGLSGSCLLYKAVGIDTRPADQR